MEIREARPEEHAALGALMVEAYAGLDGFPKPAEQPALYEMLANVGAFAGRPGIELLVAVDGPELLGGLVYFSDLANYGVDVVANERDASAFRLLVTDPRARGRGAGKALTLACIERARARGHRAVVIHSTEPMRIARGMYERLGFERAPELDFSQEGFPVLGFRLAL